MAIWDDLLKKIISPVVNESIKEVKKEEKLQKGLTALAPSWRFQPISERGEVVRRSLPRGVKFQTLRDFSLYYPILRACINYRKRQITQLKFDISSIEVITDKKKKEKYKEDAQEIKKFLKYPAGDKTLTFRTFVNKIIEDLLVLDAVAIYRRRNKGGGIYGYLPIDASTIEMVLYDDGTIPVPPDEAYQQKIGGEVKAELTIDELFYKMMNPRTDTPYGLSPVEALIIIVTTALKLSAYNLSYLEEGNIPEGLVELPEDIISSPDQLKAWQEAWDTMFSGDPRYQRKIKFLPSGIKLHPTRKIDEMQFERFEKWLLLNTCFDEQTEILTNQGWKFFKDLDRTELVATRSKEGCLEFQKPTAYQEYYYDGKMVEFKSKMVDLLVTPDHRMLTCYNHRKDRGISDYKFEKANTLVGKDGHFVPVVSDWRGKDKKFFIIPKTTFKHGFSNGNYKIREVDSIKIPMDIWCSFLGLWLAEGWTKGSKEGKKPGTQIGKDGKKTWLGYTVGIAQKKEKHRAKIEELLGKMPFRWRYDKNRGYATNNIGLWKYLHQLGNVYTKRVPKSIPDLSPKYLKLLWEWYVIGDGYTIKKGRFNNNYQRQVVVSVNKKLIDDFQEVLTKIGLSGTISIIKPMVSEIRGKKVNFKKCYRLTKRTSKNVRANGKYIDYSGVVYDCTVPNGTLYVRRNGKPVWTGNCSVLEVPPQAIGFQFERGKGATEAEWEIGKERGLFPTANFLKEFFDQIIQEDLKMPHLEFVWVNINPTNKQEEANVFSKLVNAGAVSVDEWRLGEGLDTIGCPHYIMTPVGPIFVKDLVARSEAGESILPQSYQPSGTPPKPPKKVPEKIQQIAQDVPEKIQRITREEIVEELKRWKKVASNDLKQGKEFRDFQTNIIDFRTKNLIKNGLKVIKTKNQLNQLFDPLISQENQMIAGLLDLYDEVSAIVRFDEATNIKKNPKSN